jgi:hypothetical protein
MEIIWQCSCGRSMNGAHEAFLHRDGSARHQVTPLLVTNETKEPKPAGPLLYWQRPCRKIGGKH